jgi:hypothetical protein
MNVSNVGSPAQYLSALDPDSGVSGSVAVKVLQQEKTDGQDEEDLIQSASQQPSDGHSLSVYA